MSKPVLVLVTGNTYPVREQIKKLGGRWDAASKGWLVPEGSADAANKLVAKSPRTKRAAATIAESRSRFDDFVPTDEQRALGDFILGRTDNLFCEAGAGAGKTTTALWLVHLMLQRSNGALDIVFVTFGRNTKEDVKKVAPEGAEVVTFNGLGHRALMRAWSKKIDVDPDLIWTTFRKLGAKDDDLRERGAWYSQVRRLVELGKGALAESVEDLQILIVDHDLALENGDVLPAAELAHRIMDAARKDHSPRAVIDYTDQMWLPVVLNLRMPQYDVIVIDEAQDTNELQLELITRCTAEASARVIAVGDRRQSIYGFRGADRYAVDAIIERFAMTRLPLMTTFRCAKSIVREAQRIVPEYRAGESNPEGVVRSASAKQFLNEAQVGDFVISRTNAPLISWCIRALARGIPAAVVGRGVGQKLQTLAKKMLSRCSERTVLAFETAVEEWARREIEKLEKKIPIRESLIENVRDNADCLLAFCDGASDIPEVLERIERTLRDDASGERLDFTTAHRAKGRERSRVFLFEDTFLKSRKDRRSGEWLPPSEEEYNLKYVGITRAKYELVYVNGAAKAARGE